MPTTLTVRQVTAFQDWVTLRPVWNELLLRSSSPTVFLTFEWLTTWWECFAAPNTSLFILVVERNGTVVGLAPLMKVRERVLGTPVRRIQFISMMREAAHPSNVAGQLDIIAAAGDIEAIDAVFSFLREVRREWDYMRLHPILHGSDLIRWFESAGASRLNHGLLRDAYHSSVLQIQGPWAEYSAAHRHRLNKVRRNAERPQTDKNKYVFSQYESVDEIPGRFETLLDVERRSWKWEKGVSLNSTFYHGFYRRLAEKLSRTGMLKLYLLELNGRPIAYSYCLEFANIVSGLKMSHDETHRRLGPGLYLLFKVLEAAHEKGLSAVDFLWGDEEYKDIVTNSQRQYQELFVFSRPWRGRMSEAYYKARFLNRSINRVQDIRRRLARKLGIHSSTSELTREDQVRNERREGE